MHYRRSAKHTLNHEQLLEQIGSMLSREARKRPITLSLGTMTRRAGRDLSSRYAFHEDLLALDNERRVTASAFSSRLFGKIRSECADRGVVELRCHAPHIGLCIRVSPRLILESMQLQLDIGGRLRR